MPADSLSPPPGAAWRAYQVALGVYAAVLPTLADHQVEGRLRGAVDARRVADTRALLELIERRIPRPGPSLAAALEQGRQAVSQGTW